MKRLLLCVAFAFSLMLSPQLFAQQGIGTNQPDKSAALEIVSNQRGLLIPRFGIPDLQNPEPVTNPANALLVFNDGTEGTAPGFYWWNQNANGGDGAWKAVTGEGGEPGETPEININGVNPITVQNQGENTWSIGLEVGNDGDVLVTNADGEAVWTPLDDFVSTVNIVAENGVISFPDPNTGQQVIQLGGTLTEASTEITTDGDNNTLAITGLIDLTEDVDEGVLDIADFDVLVMNDNGILKRISTSQLMGEVTVELDIDFVNGLTQVGDVVKLGGTLTESTTLTTDENNTLAIDGLQAATAANKIVVAEDAEGALRTVMRSLQADVAAATYNISTALAGYSPYVQEINLNVSTTDLSGGDITLTLPDAAPASGQVINVKLSGDTEASNYLNIDDATGNLTYGAMPYQAWVLKSNGANWQIVARN